MSDFETLVDLFEHTVEAYPNHRLFGQKRAGEYTWTNYRSFGQKVDAFRGGLAHRGVSAGDTVAVIADNCPEWAVGAYATYGLGARYCPMYQVQQPKDWRYIVGDSGARALLVANRNIYGQAQAFVDEFDHLQDVIFIDGPPDHADYFGNVLEDGRAHPCPTTRPQADTIATFIYTSGTTGDPKGVCLSHRNICSNIAAISGLFDLDDNDVSLSFLPWAHSFGQTAELHLLFSCGAALGLVDDVSTIVDDFPEVRPTLLMSVPRVFNQIYAGVRKKVKRDGGLKRVLFDSAIDHAARMRRRRENGRPGWLDNLKHKAFDAVVFRKIRQRFGGRLRYAISGGAALNPEVARFIDTLDIPVYEGYGLTETSPIVAVNTPGARKIGSVGRPIPGVDVDIRPLDGYDEGVGEVMVRGPNVMQRYHGLPDKTDQAIEADGALHTGDLGRLDSDGFLWISGRVKEQYKLQNGKYVVPGPIEEQLKLSPYIDQIMITGINRPHNVALIVVDEASLSEWLEDRQIDRKDALDHPDVVRLYARELRRWGEDLKGYEHPQNFGLINQQFTPENDMLTPSLKLKRRVVMANYRALIDGLYDHEDGR